MLRIRKKTKLPLTRSEIMARMRSYDTTPELAVRSYLWRKGIRFRLKQRVYGVRPDIAWKRRKIAVFVDGCFWHGCPLHCRRPSTRTTYWNRKIEGNMERDADVTQRLREEGWTVLRFWEHEVSSDVKSVCRRIVSALTKAK